MNKQGNVTQYNEGGSHDQNQLGGIPIGANASVEQGETSIKSSNGQYVFSDRIQITPQIAQNLSLPKTWVGKTMADYSKKIDKQFEGRGDSISTSTKQRLLDRGVQEQENIKAQQEALIQAQNTNAQQAPEDMIQGQIPQGMEEYSEGQMAYGGYRKQMFTGGDTTDPLDELQTRQPLNATQSMVGGQSVVPAQNNMQIGNVAGLQKGVDVSGNTTGVNTALSSGTGNTDTKSLIGSGLGMVGDSLSSMKKKELYYDPNTVKQAQTVDNVGKAKDAAAAVIGPWGALFRGVEKLGQGAGNAIGGDAGAGVTGAFSPDEAIMRNNQDPDSSTGEKIAGIFNPIGASINVSRNQRMRQNREGSKQATRLNNYFSDQYAEGGLIDPYYTSKMDKFKKDLPMLASENATNTYYSNNPPMGSMFQGPSMGTEQTKSSGEPYPKFDFNKASDRLGGALRYAPLAMDAYQLSQLKKPQTESTNKLSNRYDPRYVDLANQQNIANQELNNVSNAIQQSGASQGAVRSNLLGAQLNRNKALAQAYMQAEGLNAQEAARAAEFNTGVDRTNLTQSNIDLENRARDIGNYDTQKSKLLGNIGTTAGEIGKEEKFKDITKGLYGYDSNGKYIITPEGEKQYLQEDEKSKKKALGGYVIKRKKY